MDVRDYDAFDSRESILHDIMDALKDATVKRIGVYGMGGVGKTTLVKKVAQQAKEYKLFDEVAISVVTQNPDNRKIRDKIASDLGLKFEQRENEFDRAGLLHNRLKKGKRVLVILDDIWAKPDFEAIGIPFGDDGKESAFHKEDRKEKNDDDQRVYKILVTSRSVDILRNDMNIRKNFLVETVSSQEAQNLFWKIVVEYDSAKSSTDFLTTGEEIVGKCAGLPLAIATIANALKSKSIHAWEDALEYLRTANPKGIPEMNEKVVSVIELSFNILPSEEAKKLLFLCSLIYDGYQTNLDDLVKYCMGWGLFQNVLTLQQGRNRVCKLIDTLKSSCLLLEGETDDRVRMHEFVYAVAISVGSTNNLMFCIQDAPDLDKVLKEKISKNSTAISLPHRDISELPERLEFPKLELFFLFMNSPSLQIPDKFFEGMEELKVIDITCLNLRSLPSSFVYLTNLQTLCLDYCLLGDISIVGELKNLEILSFLNSSIEKLPKEIGKLTRLKLLDLRRCSELKAIAPNVISRLSQLEELYLDDSPVQWEDELDNQDGSNANLAELNQLCHLTTLNMRFPDAQPIPPNLRFQQLKRFRILIGNMWKWTFTNKASRSSKMKLNNSSYLRYKPIKVLLEITEDLHVDELDGFQNVLYELDGKGFPHLKYLHMQNGHELLYIVNSAGRLSCNVFPMLESLSLNNLIKLKKICHGSLKQTSFSRLKSVKVNKCDGLKHLFSISMAKSLSQLEEIQVTDCENLIVIFAEEDDEDRLQNQGETNSIIEFGRLRCLTLEGLPKFTSFSLHVKTHLVSHTTEDHEDSKTLFARRVVLPALSELGLSSIAIVMIRHNKLLATSFFQNLTILDIEGCDKLRYLLPSCLVKSLVRLQQIKIRSCMSMECVILTEEEGMSEMIKFPTLEVLVLADLPMLKMFCKDTGNLIEFPSLSKLEIFYCGSMETFISNSISADIQPLFDEKVTLPKLEILMILNMGNLRKIWDDDQHNLDSFSRLRHMRLEKCNKLLNIFPSVMHERLQRLEVLRVQNCDSLEEIFKLQALRGRETNVITASQLRQLVLHCLPNLKRVWNMHNRVILGFRHLHTVEVCNCNNLESIFPASIARDLLELQKLWIDSCMMDEIVHKEEKDVGGVPRFIFYQLASLVLADLPRLRCFYSGIHISDWPVLKKLAVNRCTKVEILASKFLSLQQNHEESQHGISVQHPLFLVDEVAFPSLEHLKLAKLPELLHLWKENSQPSEVFQYLATLEVDECNQLTNIFQSSMSFHSLAELKVSKCEGLINLVTSTTARSMMQLTRMDITDCKRIEQIIRVTDMESEVKDEIVFKELEYMKLHRLPRLGNFCSGNCSLEFPSLEKLLLRECPNMESFSQGEFFSRKLKYTKAPKTATN